MELDKLLEYIAVFFGIVSVWFSRREHILVYPTGLINTIIYIYLSFKFHLPGEASVNFYYTIMSLYGWYIWSRRDVSNKPVLKITYSTKMQWVYQLAFFAMMYVALYIAISYMKQAFADEAIPWADAFASATAYTGMWLMARKKVESWYWWIATNIASIPLYYVKGLKFTSFYYAVLLLMAIWGLIEWQKKVKKG